MLCVVLLLAAPALGQFPLSGGLKTLIVSVDLPAGSNEPILVNAERKGGKNPLFIRVDPQRNVTEGGAGDGESSEEGLVSAPIPANALQFGFLSLRVTEDDAGFSVSQMSEPTSLQIPKEGAEAATSLEVSGAYAKTVLAVFGSPLHIAEEDFAVGPVPFRSHNQLQISGKLHASSDGSLTIYSIPVDGAADSAEKDFDPEDFAGDIPLRIVAQAGAAAYQLSARKDGTWADLPAPQAWAWQDNTAVPLKAGESFKVDMLFRTPMRFFSGRGIRLWVFGPSEDAYNRNMFGFSFADIPGLNATEQRIIVKADADIENYNLARTP